MWEYEQAAEIDSDSLYLLSFKRQSSCLPIWTPQRIGTVYALSGWDFSAKVDQ